MRILSTVFFAVVFFTFSLHAQIQDPADIPIEVFASLPNLDGADLSPDGKRIAYLIPDNGRQQLRIHSLTDGSAIAIPPLRDTEINTFYWASPEIILVKLTTETNRFHGSRATQESKLISFNTQTHESKWLGKPKNSKVPSGEIKRASQFETIKDFLPNEPDFILLQLDMELDGMSSLYKVNVRSGRRALVQGDRSNIQNWYTDSQHEVRLGTGYDRDGEWHARFKNQNGKWIDLEELNWSKDYSIRGFSPREGLVYVRGATEHGTKGMFLLDLSTGMIVETLFSNERIDYSHLLTHPISHQIAGVAHFEKGLKKSMYFDKELDAVQRSLEAKIQGASIQISGRAKDKPLYLALASNSQTPGLYFLFDQTTGNLNYLDTRKPGIASQQMATTQMIDIEARDGTLLESALTVPLGTAKDEKRPSVILPHGGPTSQDTAHWDEWAQFLASRGYVVLQPNFRGSTGYGYDFENAGDKQWGGLMQDDVTDATHWLIDHGYAEAQNICIMGASYGGYAALMGVIKEQGLYKCAISINGVPNLPSLRTVDRSLFIGGKSWTETMGLEGSPDKEVSPYHRASEINVPVLLMASKDDTRIRYQQSRDFHKKLKKRKLSTYVQLKSGGHYLNTEKSRKIILREVEKFLAEHIGQ